MNQKQEWTKEDEKSLTEGLARMERKEREGVYDFANQPIPEWATKEEAEIIRTNNLLAQEYIDSLPEELDEPSTLVEQAETKASWTML